MPSYVNKMFCVSSFFYDYKFILLCQWIVGLLAYSGSKNWSSLELKGREFMTGRRLQNIQSN